MSSQSPIQLFIEKMIHEYRVEIRFKQEVITDDFTAYQKGDIKLILKAILKCFKTNSNPHHVVPDWVLHGDLRGAYKIRLLDEGIRIIYRIAEEKPELTVVDVYAVGPRKNELAYQIAKSRKDW